ncbi:MAG: OsmC family protein [Candidatus Omnitrophica bacterium]|nr:OsmC family protein [Candidatus Omnitrophota bacterium]
MSHISKSRKSFTHKTVITWNEKKKTFLCSLGKKTIEIAESLESKKHDDMWTPKELFVTSVEGFVKGAFIDLAKKNGLEFLSYESTAQGVIEKVENKFRFAEIKVWPRIAIVSSGQIEKAKELIELAGKNFFTSNFIRCKLSIYPEIKVE